MLLVLLIGLALAAVVGPGEGTPEQRLKKAGFASAGAPNFLVLFGSEPIDHGVLLHKDGLTLALVEFEGSPPIADDSSGQAIVGKTMIALVGPDSSEDLRLRFADAVRIARG